ncbi:MAG: response regulator transcription factor [Lachnospiraceae bacterium]|nr:response regulator transcription factor [Lachnospiraceae bacterium]
MYIIAVCDDEEKELDRIEAFLIRYRDVKQTLVYQVERFASAEELLERVREEDYVPDLLLLDIFMSGMSGIEAAKEMRRLGHDMPIIFLTTSTDFALDAYRVDAIQYLVKPLNQERFFRALDSAIGQSYKIKESQIAIKVAGGIRQIQPNDIVYCESQKNYQVLYLLAEKYKVRMTAGSLWEMLEGFSQFGRCGRSYILNMNHIVSVEREEIIMDNGSTIYIPRNKTSEFKKVYFSYYFD